MEAQLVSARFDYDTELVGREEIDDKRLIGLPRCGQDQPRRVARLCVGLNLDGFAPASQWQELSAALPTNDAREVA